MDLPSILSFVYIVATIIVGYILVKQIKSQNRIIGHYKDLFNGLSPEKNLSLKDEEIKQIQKNASNNLKILQKQNEELCMYMNHLFNTFEKMGQDVDDPFDRQAVIVANMPSCLSLISLNRASETSP